MEKIRCRKRKCNGILINVTSLMMGGFWKCPVCERRYEKDGRTRFIIKY